MAAAPSPNGSTNFESPEHKKLLSGIQQLLLNNKKWADETEASNPGFFKELAKEQKPEFLYIGCSDSRVPANQVLGIGPGEVFVQRNIGNLATPKDMNCMSCLEYAVNHVKVKHVIVCGHYACGAIKAALTMPAKIPELVNFWISDLRDVRNAHSAELAELGPDQAWERLSELNVMRQVFNICTCPTVQGAWARGQPLAVHGLVYSMADGLLKEVTAPVASPKDFEMQTAGGEATGVLQAKSTTVRRISKTLNQNIQTHLFWENGGASKTGAAEVTSHPVEVAPAGKGETAAAAEE